MIDEKTRENLNKCLPVYCEPEDEAEHFYVCEKCGRAVDMRRLGDVLHHEEPGHEALSVQ